MRRFFNLMMKPQKAPNKTYGIYRENQIYFAVASSFSFGITWAEIDKIVLDLYKTTTDGNNILFCTPSTGPWIGYSSAAAASFTFSGLTGSSDSSPSEITDGARHKIEFSVSSNSATEITNTWDTSWAKQIGYIAIEFWKGGKMLKRFVPSVEDAEDFGGNMYGNYMVDTVSGNKIRSSTVPYYRFEEVQS